MRKGDYQQGKEMKKNNVIDIRRKESVKARKEKIKL